MTKGETVAVLSEGADVARLGEIAQQLDRLSQETQSLTATGSQLIAVLGESWQGSDLEHFDARWSVACRSLDAAGSLMHRMGAELRHQVEGQRAASEGHGGGGRGGGPTQPEPEGPDGMGIRVSGLVPPGINPGPLIAKLMAGEEQVTEVPEAQRPTDPGEGNVRLPEGADPNDPLIKDLMQTPRGRETLTYLADNGITINVDSSVSQAAYDPDTNTITISPFVETPGTLIHEASHAQWDIEGRGGDASTQDQDAYVKTQIDNEVEASTEEVYYAKERRMDGVIVERGEMEIAYDEAYAEVVEGGGSPDEADAAGRGAIEERFVPGEDGEVEVEASTTGKLYEDHYAEVWEDERAEG